MNEEGKEAEGERVCKRVCDSQRYDNRAKREKSGGHFKKTQTSVKHLKDHVTYSQLVYNRRKYEALGFFHLTLHHTSTFEIMNLHKTSLYMCLKLIQIIPNKLVRWLL